MNAQIQKQIEASAFNQAIHEWLSGQTTGHLGAYMYTEDRDDHRWKDGHSAESYYLGRDDKATFDLAVKELNLNVKHFFDLGPGGEASVRAKSLPFMKALGATEYFPVDLSPTLANEALSTMKMNIPAVSGKPLIADFFDSIPEHRNNSLLAIVGGTIGNFETHTSKADLLTRLSEIFSIYRSAVGENSYFLVSFDANTNEKEIVGAYDCPQFDYLIRGCVERAIDTNGFDYHVNWTPDNYQLALGFKSNRDQIVFFDGAQYAIEEGEYLPVLNSYRFPVSFVAEAAKKAGWGYKNTWSATGRTHYMLFAAV